jgi:hypothetical protein
MLQMAIADTSTAYYKPIILRLQQKNPLTFLTIMWKNNPFKAKSTIITKAYSSIRDLVGKQRASLATFLTLVCPKLGIINVKNYFRRMNWPSKLQPMASRY